MLLNNFTFKKFKTIYCNLKSEELMALYCLTMDAVLFIVVIAGMVSVTLHELLVFVLAQIIAILIEKIQNVQRRLDSLEEFKDDVEQKRKYIANSAAPIKIYEVVA